MWLTCEIPQSLIGCDVILGIDEAGRGPVLGPMVYACALWKEEHDQELASKGYDDSKKLSEEQRNILMEQIKQDEKVGYVTCEISARTLSERMLRTPEPVSLNRIAQDATLEIIRRVFAKGVHVKKVFVDALGNCEHYERLLGNNFPECSEITVKPKADSLYKVVSAASICAKVTRDKSLANWTFDEPKLSAMSRDWGCGYPGDEKTKTWLVENMDPVFGFPSLVRFSWQTSKNLLEDEDGKAAKSVKIHFPAEENRQGSKSVLSMFQKSDNVRKPFYSSKRLKLNTSGTKLLGCVNEC